MLIFQLIMKHLCGLCEVSKLIRNSTGLIIRFSNLNLPGRTQNICVIGACPVEFFEEEERSEFTWGLPR